MRTVFRNALLTAALVSGPQAHAQNAGNLSGQWNINANTFIGSLDITQMSDGTLSGQMYTTGPNDRITGYYSPGARQAVMLRGPASSPHQVYLATVAADGRSLSGTFYALNTANGGASTARNVFAFRALRGASAPPSPGAPPASGVGAPPPQIYGRYRIDGNGHQGELNLNPVSGMPEGTLSGNVYPDSVEGYYASGTGTLAFLRKSGGTPIQVFIGTAYGGSDRRLSGTFYPLTAAAGASPQQLQFNWNTIAPPLSTSGANVNSIVVETSQSGDVVRARRDLSCDGMTVRVFYGDTANHVDVAAGQSRAIRIVQQPATAAQRIVRWQCRIPGRSDTEISSVGCPGMPATGGNSNVARITRTSDRETRLDCLFRSTLQ